MDLAALAKLTIGQLTVLIALFLPGFVSIKIDRLIHPGDDVKAPELIIDAFGYSVVNAGLLSWLIFAIFQELGRPRPDAIRLWIFSLLVCVVGPLLWPTIFRAVQRTGARYGWFLGLHRYAWDWFFARREACWIIVHLPDGRLVGGYFGKLSYATMAPKSGDFYIEELWRLSAEGEFEEPMQRSALFRTGDYQWIEIIRDA